MAERVLVRIGTRRSVLAREQARIVGAGLAAVARAEGIELTFELVGITTAGDRILDRPLEQIGGKGLFIRELDSEMAEGRIDIAVHSCKDLPVELDPRVRIAAIPARGDVRDVLVLPVPGGEGAAVAGVPTPGRSAEPCSDLAELGARLVATGLPIGCSSARRRVQLGELFPGVPVAPIRGNVNTRLEKLDAGSYAALTLAVAGLERLGLTSRLSRVFEPHEMLPAAGQGALAVTALRRGGTPDGRVALIDRLLERYHDVQTGLCVTAERAFTRALGADCATPCGAYACATDSGAIELEGLFAPPGCAPRRGKTVGELADASADVATARLTAAASSLAERLLA